MIDGQILAFPILTYDSTYDFKQTGTVCWKHIEAFISPFFTRSALYMKYKNDAGLFRIIFAVK